MKASRFITLITCFLVLSFTAKADVIYEPLIVASGFNRDCIAETQSLISTTDSPVLPGKQQSCFATKTVIRNVNTGNSKIKTAEDLAITIESGWPDDYRDTIKCILDAKNDPLYRDVVFLLAPYDQNNVLTLRPDNAIGGTGTLKFKKVGCYNKMFFLTASLKQGTPESARKVSAIVYYTDGTTTKDTFCLAEGFGGQEGHKVCMTNIYEGYFDKNTSNYAAGKGKGCASVFDIDLDETKLVDRVEFKNEVAKSAAIIFAVTGRTAAINAPDEEASVTHEIEDNSFEACWEAIADAASYRLDVAEDPDFQNILADYNNLVVSGATCQEVAGLIAENDYYWRVRAVDSQGGQSASSAPRRVRTAPAGGGASVTTNETNANIESDLSSWVKTTVPSIDINRTLYRDGAFNTLCLPFDMDAAAIAASPLTGCELYEFVSASKVGDDLNIVISETDAIDAGVPYLIRWANTGDIIPKPLTFTDVYIKRNTGLTVGNPEDIRFVGIIGQHQLPLDDHNNLFVGAANTLYWPDNTDSKMNGFRAYFAIPHETPSGAPLRRGMPARLVEREDIPSAIEQAELPEQGKAVFKILSKDGQLRIVRDGKVYDLTGKRL